MYNQYHLRAEIIINLALKEHFIDLTYFNDECLKKNAGVAKKLKWHQILFCVIGLRQIKTRSVPKLHTLNVHQLRYCTKTTFKGVGT